MRLTNPKKKNRSPAAKNMAKYRLPVTMITESHHKVNIQLPYDQPTLKPFSGKTSFHNRRKGLQDLVPADQG